MAQKRSKRKVSKTSRTISMVEIMRIGGEEEG